SVLGDHVRHREGFARTGDTHQGLVGPALAKTVNQGVDRLGLITGRLKGTDELERGHEPSFVWVVIEAQSCPLLFRLSVGTARETLISSPAPSLNRTCDGRF